MNEPCTIEAGLFKKKPCGQTSVTKCAACEQPLCRTHTVAQKKAGIFMCKECDDAAKRYDKLAKPQQASAAPPAAQPAASAKPAPVAPAAPAAPKPADDAPLEFTPSEKPKK